MTERGEALFAGLLLASIVLLAACVSIQTTGKPASINSGDWVYVTPTFTHVCCDCGLTHKVTIIPSQSGYGYYVQWVVDTHKTDKFRSLSLRRLQNPWEEK